VTALRGTHLSVRLRRLAMLALALAALSGCGASTIPAVHSETERLALSRRSMQRGEYNVAIELLKSYIANNAGGADVDLAIELLGECQLHIKEWSEAGLQFDRVLRDYPESDSSAAAAFHLGDAYWGQSRGADFDQEYTQKALEQWQSYLRGYTGHWLNAEAERHVLQARTRLATKLCETGFLYLKLSKPGPARVYFQRVLDEYADTVREADARLGVAIAGGNLGQRDQAIAELKSLEQRFTGHALGRRAARERARLERKKT
jgi:outer membrane assembly lipoprotein YfiO